MAETVEDIVDGIFDREGRGYTNNPSDRGGPTKFGVTAAKLGESRGLGRSATAEEVQALEEPEARQIYETDFIDEPGFRPILDVAPRVGLELIDTGVNMGVATPGPWLQRGLNSLNREGRDYADLPITGHVGTMTLAATQALIAKRGQDDAEDCLLKILNSFQTVRYVELCERRQPNEEFMFGWLKNRVGL